MAKRRPSLDVDLIRGAATGRWPEILSTLGGIPLDRLDGSHHPCPKCGGSDRFRLLDKDAGAVLCNVCFNTKNGDGFSALQWSCGWNFRQAAERVADYVGVTAPKGNGKNGRNGHAKNGQGDDDQNDHLRPLGWSEPLVELWCLAKPPITSAAVPLANGRLARYRESFTVVDLPVIGQDLLAMRSDAAATAQPAIVGHAMLNITGGTLPRYRKGKPPEHVKVKLTYECGRGYVGTWQRLREARVVWKVEGVTDLLAALSLADLPTDVALLTNAFGCGEKPDPWMVEALAGKTIYVIHDCDQPGQAGAVMWSQALASIAVECRSIVLPFPIEPTHGMDLRDWISEGHTYAELQALAEASPIVAAGSSPPASSTTAINPDSLPPLPESDDDPHRLARVVLESLRASDSRLYFWREEWYRYDGKAARLIPRGELMADVWARVKAEYDRLAIERLTAGDRNPASDYDDGRPVEVRKVGRALVSNVAGALESLCVVPGVMPSGSSLLPTPAASGGEQPPGSRTWVAMRNGILRLDDLMAAADQVLYPHTPDWFSTTCLPFDFDPNAKCEKWESTLAYVLEGDQARIRVLQEWAGYCLLPTTEHQRFLVLEGEGANGKSTYAAGLQAMLGAANVSHVPLEIFGQRFALTESLGKLLNVAADCGEIDKAAEGYLKSFTSGDVMFFDRKGISGLSCSPTARLVLATNNRPRFSDRSGGLWRRMLLVPFRIAITEGRRVLGMDKPDWWEASGELPGIFNWAIRGLWRLRQQGKFTQSEVCEAEIADYRLEVNPARAFLIEHYRPEAERWIASKSIYEAYKSWCRENGYHPLSDGTFGREVRRAFPESNRVQRRDKEGKRFWAQVGVSEVESVPMFD